MRQKNEINHLHGNHTRAIIIFYQIFFFDIPKLLMMMKEAAYDDEVCVWRKKITTTIQHFERSGIYTTMMMMTELNE
jgi:hypothetical protein